VTCLGSCCFCAVTKALHSNDHLQGNFRGIYAYLAYSTVASIIFTQFIPVVYLDNQWCSINPSKHNHLVLGSVKCAYQTWSSSGWPQEIKGGKTYIFIPKAVHLCYVNIFNIITYVIHWYPNPSTVVYIFFCVLWPAWWWPCPVETCSWSVNLLLCCVLTGFSIYLCFHKVLQN
jgi:hypothetical protein